MSISLYFILIGRRTNNESKNPDDKERKEEKEEAYSYKEYNLHPY